MELTTARQTIDSIRKGPPKVQAALDLSTIGDTLRIAREAHISGVDWIEAGTPLIKNLGMASVRHLRRMLSDCTIVADMKTLDAGKMEAEIAYSAGADVVSISGLSHTQTIKDAARVRDRYDRLLMVDLLMVDGPLNRAREVERLGADIVCLHTGVDAQKQMRRNMRIDKNLRELPDILDRAVVAAAGGITPALAPRLARIGVKILIVGGWITSSRNPRQAARKIVESIRLLEA